MQHSSPVSWGLEVNTDYILIKGYQHPSIHTSPTPVISCIVTCDTNKLIGHLWGMACGGLLPRQNKSPQVPGSLVEWTSQKKSPEKHLLTFSYEPDFADSYSLSTVGKQVPSGLSTVSLQAH